MAQNLRLNFIENDTVPEFFDSGTRITHLDCEHGAFFGGLAGIWRVSYQQQGESNLPPNIYTLQLQADDINLIHTSWKTDVYHSAQIFHNPIASGILADVYHLVGF